MEEDARRVEGAEPQWLRSLGPLRLAEGSTEGLDQRERGSQMTF